MKKIFTVTFVLFVIITNLCAQEFRVINKESLKEIIASDKNHEYFMVAIFTNDCQSRHYLNNKMALVDSITNHKTRFLLCQSTHSELNRAQTLGEVVKELSLAKDKIYMIDANKYKLDPEDSREQGMEFRNDICFESKMVDIGVTYCIIFDKKSNVMYYGFT